MSSIDIESVTSAMLDAVRTEVADRWPATRALAEFELRKLATTFAEVQRRLATGETTVAKARGLIRMQENCARSVLRTVEGVSVLTSRRAVGAAIRAAATLINPVIGATVIHVEQVLSRSKPEIPTSSSSNPGSKQKAVAATRATGRAASTTAASSEPAEEATPSFKAGKDL